MVTLLSLVQNGGIAELFDAPALTMCLGYPYFDLGCVWVSIPSNLQSLRATAFQSLPYNTTLAQLQFWPQFLSCGQNQKEGPQHAYSRAHVLALPFLATFLAPLLILKPKHI